MIMLLLNSTIIGFITVETVINYSSLLIVLIGIPSNILMFIVYSNRALAKLSISIYFRAMALANFCMSVFWIRKFMGYQFNYEIEDISLFLCKSISFIIYVVSSMASWFLVAAGLDRFLIIAYPVRFQFIRKIRFLFLVLIAISLYSMLFYSNLLFFSYMQVSDSENSTFYPSCEYENSTFIFLSDLINVAIIPFIIMTISTIGLFYVVYKSRQRMNKFQQPNKSKKDKNSHNRQIRDLKFGFSMIFTNIVFLTLNGPITLYYAIDVNSTSDLEKYFTIMYYAFFSIEFFLQLAMNSLVRNRFFAYFKRD